MKYIRITTTFLIICYIGASIQRIGDILIPVAEETNGIDKTLVFFAKFALGFVIWVNVFRINNWIWNTND